MIFTQRLIYRRDYFSGNVMLCKPQHNGFLIFLQKITNWNLFAYTLEVFWLQKKVQENEKKMVKMRIHTSSHSEKDNSQVLFISLF